jgi:hypothetical protein
MCSGPWRLLAVALLLPGSCGRLTCPCQFGRPVLPLAMFVHHQEHSIAAVNALHRCFARLQTANQGILQQSMHEPGSSGFMCFQSELDKRQLYA